MSYYYNGEWSTEPFKVDSYRTVTLPTWMALRGHRTHKVYEFYLVHLLNPARKPVLVKYKVNPYFGPNPWDFACTMELEICMTLNKRIEELEHEQRYGEAYSGGEEGSGKQTHELVCRPRNY